MLFLNVSGHVARKHEGRNSGFSVRRSVVRREDLLPPRILSLAIGEKEAKGERLNSTELPYYLN